MDGKQQKRRGQNFTLGEELNLCSIILNYKDVIENKCINKESSNEKEKVWREITEIFNASAVTSRDTVQLKSKYDNLKSASKRYAQQLHDSKEAHICPPEKNIIFDTILKIINKKSINFDNDNSDESLDSKVGLLSVVQANIEDVEELPPIKRTKCSNGNGEEAKSLSNNEAVLRNAQELHLQSIQRLALKSSLINNNGNTESKDDLMNELIKLKIQYYKNEEKYHAEKMKLIALDIKIKTLELERKEKESL